jgi:hypothetical protein
MMKGTFSPSGTAGSASFAGPSALPPTFPSLRSPGDKSYSKEWAYALSVISGWAYAHGQLLADVLPDCRFPRSTHVTELSVQNDALLIVATAYFVHCPEEKIGVLVFRGTEPTSLINWLTDADTAKYRFGTAQTDRGSVHSGFFSNVQALWSDILATIDPAIRNGGIQDLYITGHSLGGAMAVIAAARIFDPDATALEPWRSRVRGIYTYGQPMVGDEKFAQAFDRIFGHFLYRHIYDDDIVPALPPRSVDEDFKHFGHRYVADARDGLWSGPKPPDRRANLLDLLGIAESFVTRRIDAFHGIRGIYSLDDHSPRGYIDVSRNSIGSNRTIAMQPVGGLPALQRALLRAIPVPLPKWPDRRPVS